MHMDHKFSEIDHETPLFKFFLVVHLQTHSEYLSSVYSILEFNDKYSLFSNIYLLMNTWFGTKNITHSLDFVVCALINLPQSENVRTIGGKKMIHFLQNRLIWLPSRQQQWKITTRGEKICEISINNNGVPEIF